MSRDLGFRILPDLDEYLHRLRVTTTALISLLTLALCSCTGTARLDHYAIQAPDNRPLTREQVKQAVPSSVPVQMLPAQELAAGAKLQISSAEVQQPKNPKESARIVADDRGVVIETGAGNYDTPSDKALGTLRIVGGVIVALGVVLLVISFSISVIPKVAGPALAIAGFVLTLLPNIIEVTVSLLAGIMVIGTVCGVAYFIIIARREQAKNDPLMKIVKTIDELKHDPAHQDARAAITSRLSVRMNDQDKATIGLLKLQGKTKVHR